MEEMVLVKKPKNAKKWVLVLSVVIVLALLVLVLVQVWQNKDGDAQVITVSTLEKIINVSELSTFTAVYNGIAEVKNEQDAASTDYYVSYEARVDAGIDFEKIQITVDHANKTVSIKLPDVFITDVTVDISSLDFIFNNKKVDKATITHEAFKACEMDVQEESKRQEEILNLAQQNADNVITALVKPMVEQLDSNYKLEVEQGGASK